MRTTSWSCVGRQAEAAASLGAGAGVDGASRPDPAPDKTRIVDARTQGFDFLGYRFAGGRRWPRDKSLTKLKDTIRAKTRRTAGRQPTSDHRRTSTGRCAAGSATSSTATARTFATLDGWIRSRLRSILRRDAERRGSQRR